MKNIIVWLVAMFVIFSMIYFSNAYNHEVYKSVPKGEITVVQTEYPIFLPKGAIILGEVHKYCLDEGITFDNTLPEGQALKIERIVKVYGRAVIYWSPDQLEMAQSLLDS